MPSALIADDEPNLSAELASRLTRFWPELHIVGMPRDGVQALAQLRHTRVHGMNQCEMATPWPIR